MTSAHDTGMSAAKSRANWAAWWKQHPNLIRIISVTVFFVWWEYAGRGMNSIFMSYPSAIFRAAQDMIASGALPNALPASMIPFGIGLVISIVAEIILGIPLE